MEKNKPVELDPNREPDGSHLEERDGERRTLQRDLSAFLPRRQQLEDLRQLRLRRSAATRQASRSGPQPDREDAADGQRPGARPRPGTRPLLALTSARNGTFAT